MDRKTQSCQSRELGGLRAGQEGWGGKAEMLLSPGLSLQDDGPSLLAGAKGIP